MSRIPQTSTFSFAFPHHQAKGCDWTFFKYTYFKLSVLVPDAEIVILAKRIQSQDLDVDNKLRNALRDTHKTLKTFCKHPKCIQQQRVCFRVSGIVSPLCTYLASQLNQLSLRRDCFLCMLWIVDPGRFNRKDNINRSCRLAHYRKRIGA